MGPFPHDAPPAAIGPDNPAGTDGFEFVEFAHPEPDQLAVLFTRMGYRAVARHRSRAITLWRQGDISYLVNAERALFSGEVGTLDTLWGWVAALLTVAAGLTVGIRSMRHSAD